MAVTKFVFSCVLLTVFLLTVSVAEMQQPTKVPRTGFLGGGSRLRYGAFRLGLRELGYVEGKTLSLSIDPQRGSPIFSPR